jgi:hypothetical protein
VWSVFSFFDTSYWFYYEKYVDFAGYRVARMVMDGLFLHQTYHGYGRIDFSVYERKHQIQLLFTETAKQSESNQNNGESQI